MFELAGLIFGGVSRLAQHWLDLKDKQAERTHEATMYDKQVELADKRMGHDSELRKMDLGAQADQAEVDALVSALQSQSAEARAAGGWAATFSAIIRPGVTTWLMLLYSMAKVAQVYLAVSGGGNLVIAIQAAYTEYDGMLLNSVISFWFADRALRKVGRAGATE